MRLLTNVSDEVDTTNGKKTKDDENQKDITITKEEENVNTYFAFLCMFPPVVAK